MIDGTTGGGIACAEAAKVSGLSKLMGEQLGVLETLPKFVIMLIICTFIGVLTEAVSNAAMSNIFLPVLAQTVGFFYVSVPREVSSAPLSHRHCRPSPSKSVRCT